MWSPEAVQDVAIGVHPQHDVVCGGVVNEGALGVDEEHVRNPDLLHQATVEGHALVVGAGERQSFILPVVTQVECHSEVLQGRKSTECVTVVRGTHSSIHSRSIHV